MDRVGSCWGDVGRILQERRAVIPGYRWDCVKQVGQDSGVSAAAMSSEGSMDRPKLVASGVPEATPAELRLAYRVGARSRVLEEHIVRLVNRGEVKFAIWGPGEEVHGVATALALSKVVEDPSHFGIVPHYRSGCLCSMWCELHGRAAFSLDVLRQQFSKDTDPFSRGRQMVYHLSMPELGILPVQSPVGMQLGKAAGYALGFKAKGVEGTVSVGIVGDGTTAEGDMHDAMNAASVWKLPLIIMVTDNGVAISTQPDEGRGIKDFKSYAEGFGITHFSCDGRDFWDVYTKTYEAAAHVRDGHGPVLFHVRNLPRFNGHSSAADVTFDLGQEDPLIGFAQELLAQGVLSEAEVLSRVEGEGRDFFAHHSLGQIMEEENEIIRGYMAQVREEPDPPNDSILENIYPPFPSVVEQPGEGTTVITYAGAIRAALNQIIDENNGVILGQDVGRLGGVMQATAGIKKANIGSIIDAPLNEPLILGTSCGLSLHKDLIALPEIQFGDYSLNAFHWLVHMGNLYWTTNGVSSFATVLRMPVDPFGGGAVYHSMSLEGYFSAIPGLVLCMPSTSFDAFGLLKTAADYRGPVVMLEPKWMYRQSLGPAFPDEPTEKEDIARLRKRIMRGEIPSISPDIRVPFGKAAVRRSGTDVTIVSWGRAVWTSLAAAEILAQEGIDAEVIDLRTIVPPDLDTVFASCEKTGRLIVAAEDRAFAGFVRSIQGAAVERFPGMPTRALGQKNVPGIAQSLALEEATILTKDDVANGSREIMATQVAGDGAWSWVPPRFFIN
jgi:2-oxoisovalerate dehydrogenase E1 component